MHSSEQDNTARVREAPAVVANEESNAASEASPPKLSAVPSTLNPVRRVADAAAARPDPARSNRVFGWCVGAGLLLLVALLAVVMFNAGVNVEVLP